MSAPITNISRDDHFEHMNEMELYVELMTDADEFEQSAKALFLFGEACHLSDEFQQAYRREVKATLEWLKENVTIRTEKRKVVTTVKEHIYLEYDHDN